MTGFRRELGLLDSVVVVAGGIVGVGVFTNPSNVARVVGDPVLILLVWTLGGGVALIGAFVWAELASRYPQVGGQYTYLQRAYHPLVGFLYGIALLFIINGGSILLPAGDARHGEQLRPAMRRIPTSELPSRRCRIYPMGVTGWVSVTTRNRSRSPGVNSSTP